MDRKKVGLGTPFLIWLVALGIGGCSSSTPPPPTTPTEQHIDLKAEREKLDQTVWASEREGRAYEQVFVRLWDRLIEARTKQQDPWSVLEEFSLNSFSRGPFFEASPMELGIRRWQMRDSPQTYSRSAFIDLIQEVRSQGYELVQSEWHHESFEPRSDDPPISRFRFSGHLLNPRNQKRYIVKGAFQVGWKLHPTPTVDSITLETCQILERSADSGFRLVQSFDLKRDGNPSDVRPLLVQDTDGDGLSDIYCGGSGHLLKNRGNFQFHSISKREIPKLKTGVVCDFDRDGRRDLIGWYSQLGLVLFSGFQGPATPLVSGLPQLKSPSVITVGDVDRDGDLDLFLAQYRVPYVGGQMPSPYFDANDGYPFFFFENQEGKRLVDRTESAGLANKRNRRTYGASFVDLDEDHDLDLLVVNDFAGIDIYENDGRGKFCESTREFVDESHNFGMAATFGDYNLDGRLDFYVSGMASTTARRLDSLNLSRDEFPTHNEMRKVMGYGNRMYLGRKPGRFAEPSFRDQVARTGWSWGTVTLDVENDGDADLAIANGHISGKSTDDYCSVFWTHDIYLDQSKPNPDVLNLFAQETKPLLSGEQSWDGYQKNVLLLNHAGESFTNVAFLLGIGDGFDGRSLVADDLDNDGRVDLLVVEANFPTRSEKLHLYRNELPTGNWIGIVPRSSVSCLGTTVRIIGKNLDQVRVITTGDSYCSQHPARVHFGLGTHDEVDAAIIHWPDGHVTRVENPPINTYVKMDR